MLHQLHLGKMFVFIKLIVNAFLNLEQSPPAASLRLGRPCLRRLLSIFDVVVPTALFASNAYLNDFASRVLVCSRTSSIYLSTHSPNSILKMATSGFQFGIELEMFLIPYVHRPNHMLDLEEFAESLTKHYNKLTTGSCYPLMHGDINGEYEGINAEIEWSVTDDQSISPNSTIDNCCELAIPAVPLFGTE